MRTLAVGSTNITIAVDDVSGSTTAVVAAAPGAGTTTYTWDPLMNRQCYSSVNALLSPPTGPDCVGASGRWVLAGYNEDAKRIPGPPLPLGSPVWSNTFAKKNDGSYRFDLGLDKVSVDLFRDQYAFVSFEDFFSFNAGTSAPVPTLDRDVHSTFNLGLLQGDPFDDGIHGPAQMLVSVSAVAAWSGYNHYLQVDLWSRNYKNCPSGCDTTVYDVVNHTPPFSDNVYVIGSALSKIGGASGITDLQPLIAGGPVNTYDIPWTKLFKAVPWLDQPASWDSIHMISVYFSLETFGKGRSLIRFDNYQTFAR